MTSTSFEKKAKGMMDAIDKISNQMAIKQITDMTEISSSSTFPDEIHSFSSKTSLSMDPAQTNSSLEKRETRKSEEVASLKKINTKTMTHLYSNYFGHVSNDLTNNQHDIDGDIFPIKKHNNQKQSIHQHHHFTSFWNVESSINQMNGTHAGYANDAMLNDFEDCRVFEKKGKSRMDQLEKEKKKFMPNFEEFEKKIESNKVKSRKPNSNQLKCNKNVIIRVKRKRDEAPLQELILELPREKKQRVNNNDILKNLQSLKLQSNSDNETYDEKSQTIANISSENQPLLENNHDITHQNIAKNITSLGTFKLFEQQVSEIQNIDSSSMLNKIKEKRTIKTQGVPQSMKDVQKKYLSNHDKIVKTARLAKIKQLREENVEIVELEFSNPNSDQQTPNLSVPDSHLLSPFKDLLKDEFGESYVNDLEKLAHSTSKAEKDHYVYDFYYQSDEVSQSLQKTIIKVSDFDPSIDFLNEYAKEDEYNNEDYDSDDSNASGYYKNDYPDEEMYYSSEENERYHGPESDDDNSDIDIGYD